jgi:N6-L-threonylcarbamoyladenine synthase
MSFLGIDTSNYTTSVALMDGDSIIQRKKLLPVKSGSLGLRQSDAVFHHTQRLWRLYSDLVADTDTRMIEAVGVSSRPRPVEGSYMPCFSVGYNAARIIADTLKVPLLEFSHQEGHIAAALYSAKKPELFGREFLAFHVSGGTTEAVLATPDNGGFRLELAADTLDLNAGQAVDRVGLMLGLDFPCGPELEKLALKFDGEIKVKPTLKGADCCLSGLENLCRNMYDNNSSKEKISCFCIKYIEQTLCEMTDRLLEKYGKLPLVFAGGVMSNSIIRKTITERYGAAFAEPEFSSDNAAGVAYLTSRKIKNGDT